MRNNKACADFLRQNTAYRRLMEELRKKWKSYGKVTGIIRLTKTTEEERRAVGGIVGKVFMEETICISFRELEEGLQKTRYAPIDMKSLLEEYFSDSLHTNKEQKKTGSDGKAKLFCRSSLLF